MHYLGNLAPKYISSAIGMPRLDRQPSARTTDGAGSSLIVRNVIINKRRTSMRLEPAMWDALADIGRREKLTIHQICTIVAQNKNSDASFTAAIRVFAMSYFIAAATEDGHAQAGHGSAFAFSSEKDFAAIRK